MDNSQRRAELDRMVIAALAGSPTISAALRNLLQAIAQYLNCEFGAIWQSDETDTRLRCFATWESPSSDVDDFRRTTEQLELEPGQGLPGRVWADREPAWIEDVLEDSNFPRAELAERCGLHGALAFPILGPDGMEAVIEFFTREPAQADESILQTVETVGLQVGLYLARMRVEAKSQWLAAVVESSEDAIVAARLNGQIVSWNAGAEKLYGYRADEIIGLSLSALTPEGYADENDLLATRIRGGEAVEDYETVRKRKDGSLIRCLTVDITRPRPTRQRRRDRQDRARHN